MAEPGWRFKELTPGDTRINATHLEFFRDEALANPADAFVREDIQNRLDARHPSQRSVRVVYRFRIGSGAVPADRAARWLAGLAPHLEAPATREELDESPDTLAAIPFLLAEDYRTTGLDGDPHRTSDPEDRTIPNDFYWFVRNVGRSGKHGSDRGRWGLGKIVYPAASAIRSFFALTVRRSDQRRLLVGRSVLAVHRVDGADYDSEGYFGQFDSVDFPSFCTPVESSETHDAFAQDFGLQRSTDEPGLSIVVPFPLEDINAPAVAESVILHYFDEILRDRLEIVVEDDSGFRVHLHAPTFEDAVAGLPGATPARRNELLARLRFARDARRVDPDGPSSFALTRATAPKWQGIDEMFATPEAAQAARAAYRDGALLRFDVPVAVRRNRSTATAIGQLTVFVQRNEDSNATNEIFIRDGLTISGLRVLREPGVTALTLIEDDALSTLLGDAENPAHTTWVQSTKHFRGKYQLGPTILSFVRHAATQLSGFLGRSEDSLDEDLLQHLFSLPLDDGHKLPRPKVRPGGSPPGPPPDIAPSRPRAFAVTSVESGFSLRATGLVQPPPEAIVIRAAYESLRGNPFKQHHPADFDFSANDSGLRYDGEGVELRMEQPNRMRVRLTDPAFHLTVTGFDPHRDLVVDARSVNRRPTADEPADDPEGES